MPFGLCNAPSLFQSFVNKSLQEYLDDILIFSDNLHDHRDHVKKVLQRLRESGLDADAEKSEFHVREVKDLGMIVSTVGIKMDPDKIKIILDPSMHEGRFVLPRVRQFYQMFIARFGLIAYPLTELTKGHKEKPFEWTAKCQEAFEKLKNAFNTAPVLAHFDPEADTWVEVDASDWVVAGVVSQAGKDGKLHPVTYFSKKCPPRNTKSTIRNSLR